MWYTYYFSRGDTIIGRLPIYTNGSTENPEMIAARNFLHYCDENKLNRDDYEICRVVVGYLE